MRRFYLILLLSLTPVLPSQAGIILFLGDSLTAGYGLDPAEAYPALIGKRLQDAGYTQAVVNAGVSGDTSAAALRRVDWVTRGPVSVLVLAIGANDALRGLPVEGARSNLNAIIRSVKARHPDAGILLCGMRAPPNLGPAYAAAFEAIYPAVARQHGARLMPFLLEGVAGEPALNLQDGIHPNGAGQRQMADRVWSHLEPLLRR